MEHPVSKTQADAAAVERVLSVIRETQRERGGQAASNLARLGRRLLADRQMRAELFTGLDHLFGEPCWDMLLYLFSRPAIAGPITVTELGKGTRSPQTTIIRYLRALERSGIIVKRGDFHDRRKTFVSLTERGTNLMERYLVSIEW